MRAITIIMALIPVLLMPAFVSAQTPDRISVLDTFGTFEKNEPVFIFGQIASLSDGSYLIMQIFNPLGELCQIQQILPLPNGVFITETIPLKGRICGVSGQYEVKLFYDEYTKSASFTLVPDAFTEVDSEQKVQRAQVLIAAYSEIISDIHNVGPSTANLTSDLGELRMGFVDLWDEFFTDEFLYEVDPLIRPAVSSSLDSVIELLEGDQITFETAKSIDRITFESVFYYGIGDRARSIELLNDAFIEIKNLNPTKVQEQRTPTYAELEDTLLNLMTKTDSVMNRSVKSEIAFIFSRGTGPLYINELGGLVDMLTKTRYLDVVSRKDTDLYNLVSNAWESLKISLQGKESIESMLEQKEKVDQLHSAAILLRELDDVEDFVSSDPDENSQLAQLLLPDWNNLQRDLTRATSAQNIIDSRDAIEQMAKVIDISARITKSVSILEDAGGNSDQISQWRDLLNRVDDAGSLSEILEIVTAFDNSINELREKRDPISTLEFQYTSMKQKAELQSDNVNLHQINNALRVLDQAKRLSTGTSTQSKIDRIEVLLVWASQNAPKIQAELDSYSKDIFKVRAGDILQRAKSLENLVELGTVKSRFLPNYNEFADSILERLDVARGHVLRNDLDSADKLVNELFDEWRKVRGAYDKDPHGSPVGYSLDELKRIDLRKKLDAYDELVSTFYNSGFAEHADEYEALVEDARELIDIANFVDAEPKITEIGDYLTEYLALNNSDIIYDISFDLEQGTWIIQGASNKPNDQRDDLHLTVYNMDGSKHSLLEFSDTKDGDFYTQWHAPTEPGLYVVLLQYRDSQATQIVHIEEQFDTEYDEADLDLVTLARHFDELKSFTERFSNGNSNEKLRSVITEIKNSLKDKNAKTTGENIDELKLVIERYLPIRSRSAVIETSYDGNQLVLTGAVQKELAFSEDLFIDIYDQTGKRVRSVALKDDTTGLFNEVLTAPFKPGIHVAQLEYHDVAVTDFFNVN